VHTRSTVNTYNNFSTIVHGLYMQIVYRHEQANIKLGRNSSKDAVPNINSPGHFKELSNSQQARRRGQTFTSH
jgi:hypothetical protein